MIDTQEYSIEKGSTISAQAFIIESKLKNLINKLRWEAAYEEWAEKNEEVASLYKELLEVRENA